MRCVDIITWNCAAVIASVGLLFFALVSCRPQLLPAGTCGLQDCFDLGLMLILLVLRACCARLLAWHGITFCTEREVIASSATRHQWADPRSAILVKSG